MKKENKEQLWKYNDDKEADDRVLEKRILFEKYRENRDQPVRFFSKNGVQRNLIDYIQDSVDRFNEYFPKPSYKDDWQSNSFEPNTRDKLISILSRIVSTKLGIGMEVKGKRIVDMDKARDRAEIFLDLLENANDVNDDDQSRVWEAFRALNEGTVIGYEGWRKDTGEVQYVKEIDPETGEKKVEKMNYDFFDDVYGEIVPLEEFYPETIWISEMKNLRRCFRRKIVTLQQFKDEFGKYPNADKVQHAGYYRGLENFQWGVSTDVRDDYVEVLLFFSEKEDNYYVCANSIELYNGCLPWNHKRLPFWKAISEPIHEQFFYGKSLPDKLMTMQDINNSLLNAMLDQLYLSLNSPIFVDGQIDDFDGGYLEPSRIYTMEQGTRIQKGTLGVVDPTVFSVLSLIKRSMESSSISDQSQGIATGGRKTRYEVQTLNEGAMQLASLFVTLLESGLRRKYWLRTKNIIQYYSMPSKVESGKQKYKFIVLEDRKLINGKTGKKMIEILGSDEERSTLEDLANIGKNIEGEKEYDPTMSRVQPIQLTKDWLMNNDYDFEIKIIPFSSVKETATDKKNKDIQFYQLTNGDPMFDQEMNKRDLARAFGKDPSIVRNKEDIAAEQSAMPGQEGFDPTAGLPSLGADMGMDGAGNMGNSNLA